MFERILQTNSYIKGKYPWLSEKEEWIVLAEDLREVLYTAHTFEDCKRWLQHNCQSCEDE